MKRPTLRQINNGLSIVAILLALYLVLAPFWPKATFTFQEDPPLVKNAPSAQETPAENTLVIPSMKFQATIYESTDASALRKGIWHRPTSSTPDEGGNTVITGHRFTYGGPSVLYHLDKVQIGDDVTVYWGRKQYSYQVRDILTVSPSDRRVEAPATEPVLTIYTCTPLFTAKDRLVIQAVPVGESE